MSLSIVIVGLPNSGKSTLFNALLKKQIADVGEYPFTTVEPNTGVVKVSDNRLDELSKVLGIEKKIPAAEKFYDIAGLIKGAHEGEGLGNKFLAQIRQVDAILHLARGFHSQNVTHVAGRIDPVHDINTINLELTLADFELVSKQLKEEKQITTEREKDFKKILKTLGDGKLASEAKLDVKEKELIKDLNLLTLKPMLYLLNGLEEIKNENLSPFLVLSFKDELDLTELSNEEVKELELASPKLDKLIKSCYNLLNLIKLDSMVI